MHLRRHIAGINRKSSTYGNCAPGRAAGCLWCEGAAAACGTIGRVSACGCAAVARSAACISDLDARRQRYPGAWHTWRHIATTSDCCALCYAVWPFQIQFVVMAIMFFFGFMTTYHINGQNVETLAFTPPKVERYRLPLRCRHLCQVRTYGARVGRSLVLQPALL